MKFLFILSFALMLLQSCDVHSKRVDRKYILENGTEHELKIEFFEFGKYKHTDHIIGTGVVSEGLTTNDSGDNTLKAIYAFSADSVIVLFDNKRRQVYTFISVNTGIKIQPKHRNILVDSSYIRESNELYRFTFTEEDYQNAEEL